MKQGKRSRHTAVQLAGAALLFLALTNLASAGNTWTGGGASNNWSDNNNWGGATPGYGTLTFTTGGTQGTTSNNNSITSMNELLWTGSLSWILNGSTTLSLFDNSGTQAKVENQSTSLVTINDPITFAATAGAAWGEINAVNGGLTFGTGTLTVNGSQVAGIRMFGSGQTTTFNDTVSATGKYFGMTATNDKMVIGGTFTSGDIYVMNGGTLQINSGASVTSSAIRLGGDFGTTGSQNLALGGTLEFTSLTGGQSFSSVINPVSGNTSGALTIKSDNTSGTNTLSAASFLDSALTTTQAAGGLLLFQGGSVDFKAQTLTVSGSGNTTLNENLLSSTSSSSVAGGSLIKTGSGTLIIQSTGNSYTGSSGADLNGNGTQIAGGTLGIYGDTSLGNTPNGAYNNIQFTGTGTLQDTNSNITLNVNRNVSLATGVTATFDTDGNTFTIPGLVNTASTTATNLVATGGGTLILQNTANTYTGANTSALGTTTITGNTTLGIYAALSLGSTPAGAFNSILFTGTGGTLQDTNSNITLGNVRGINIANTATATFDSVGNTFTLQGIISGSGGAVNIKGTNGTGIVAFNGSAANTYSGLTTVSSGELDLDDTGGVAVGGNLTINGGTVKFILGNQLATSAFVTINGGTLNLNGQTQTVMDLKNLGGIFETGAGSWTGTSNSMTWGVGSTNTINTGGSVTDIHVTVTGGTNTVQSGGALNINPAGTGLEMNGGTLTLNSDASTPGQLSLMSNVVADDGTTSSISSGGSAAMAGAINLNGATRTFTVGSSNAATTLNISASIKGTSGGVTKAGPGSLVLSGANTFTGATTVNSGTLNAAANNALGSTSGVMVNNGGTLAISNSSATDRIGNGVGVTLNGGTFLRSGSGTVSEGSGASTTNGGATSTGTNAVGMGALTLQATSTLDFGTGGVGTLVFSSFVANAHVLNIVNYTSSASPLLVSGTDGTDDRLIFNQDQGPLGNNDLADFSFGGLSATEIALGGGFFEIVPIPEPGTWLGAGLALATLAYTQRRRFIRR